MSKEKAKPEAMAVYAALDAEPVPGCSKIKLGFETGKAEVLHATIMSDEDIPKGWTADHKKLAPQKAK